MLSRNKIITIGIILVLAIIITISIVLTMIPDYIYSPKNLVDSNSLSETSEDKRQKVIERMNSEKVMSVFLERYPNATVDERVYSNGHGNIFATQQLEESYLFLQLEYSPVTDTAHWKLFCKEKNNESAQTIWEIHDRYAWQEGYVRQYDIIENNECKPETETRIGQFPNPMTQREENTWKIFSNNESYQLFMKQYPDGIHEFRTVDSPTSLNMLVHKMNHTNGIILELYLQHYTDMKVESEKLHCRDIPNEKYFTYMPIKKNNFETTIKHHLDTNFCLDGERFYKDSDVEIEYEGEY